MAENGQSAFYGQQATEHDEVYGVKKVASFEFDPSGVLKRTVTGNLASRVVLSGADIYIGKATIGGLPSDPVWQIKKIDTTAGALTTWADGDDNFDNIFDDHAILSYL